MKEFFVDDRIHNNYELLALVKAATPILEEMIDEFADETRGRLFGTLDDTGHPAVMLHLADATRPVNLSAEFTLDELNRHRWPRRRIETFWSKLRPAVYQGSVESLQAWIPALSEEV